MEGNANVLLRKHDKSSLDETDLKSVNILRDNPTQIAKWFQSSLEGSMCL
jgi:hypothetical protein